MKLTVVRKLSLLGGLIIGSSVLPSIAIATEPQHDIEPFMRNPVKGPVSVEYKDKDYPFRGYFEHAAIDYAVPQNTFVKAAAKGEVIRVMKPWKGKKGKKAAKSYAYLQIKHKDEIATVYGHMRGIRVKEGDIVKRGDIIGRSGGKPGTRGAGQFTTGPHLHFEVWKAGIKQNPRDYLKKQPESL